MNVDVLDDQGRTPLMHAVKSKQPRGMKAILLFLEKGSDVNILDSKDYSALYLALNDASDAGCLELQYWPSMAPGEINSQLTTLL